jgi:hypothetical protein
MPRTYPGLADTGGQEVPVCEYDPRQWRKLSRESVIGLSATTIEARLDAIRTGAEAEIAELIQGRNQAKAASEARGIPDTSDKWRTAFLTTLLKVTQDDQVAKPADRVAAADAALKYLASTDR